MSLLALHHQTPKKQGGKGVVAKKKRVYGQKFIQHDGPGDDDSDLSDETDSDESEADQNPQTNTSNRQEDEESLNSADDVSGTDATEIFETGNTNFYGLQKKIFCL